MRLCACDVFSEADWQRAFQAYVAVNRSHWTGPPFAFVRKMLDGRGAYEFHVPTMGTWASRFRLEVRGDDVHALFVTNDALTGRMRERLDEMARAFEKMIQ